MTGSRALPLTDDARAQAHDPIAHWGAIYAMALCTFSLIACEFMPVSLLSPIARDLNLTEGQAGQAISISGLFAVLTSLSIMSLTKGLDRRFLLMGATLLLIVSGACVSLAPDYLTLMIGRAFIGVAVGCFWSITTATVMRLVPDVSLPKALGIVFGGNAVAQVIAAPLGSYVGGLVGWRGAFFCIVPIAAIALVWQAVTLPRLPSTYKADGAGVFAVLCRLPVALGMAAILVQFTGQFAIFTYLRPFLEQVTRVDLTTLSAMLLIVGVAGFCGTYFVSPLLDRRLPLTLATLPGVLAVTAVMLALFGTVPAAVGMLLFIWGFASGAGPIAWQTWLARTMPADAEAGGGLMVAVVQIAITAGATLGGFAYDMIGAVPDFLSAAAILVGATIISTASVLHDSRPSLR